MNTTDYLLECADPNSTALISGKTQYSYRDVRTSAERVLAALVDAGVAPGDRVGLLGNNSLFWVASYLAIIKLGAVVVPFATTLTPDEVGRLADFIQCKVICAERRVFRNFAAVLNGTMIFENILEGPGKQLWPSSLALHDPNQDAALMFTSGTTARPRLVRITHKNIQANTNSIIEYLNLTSQERVLAVLQFFYCFGTSLLHTHLRAGASIVMATSFAFPEVVVNMLEENACTGFAGVPSTFQTLLRNSTFPKRALRDLRKIQQAGGKLQNVLIEELARTVPQANVYVMYGQTEGTARLSYLPPELLPTKLGSIGTGIPGVTLKVLGEDHNPVRPGEVGEIIAWGDNISPGYWNDPEASAGKFIDGALSTGDLATVDEDGFIFVVDRKADFIKSYGNRVSSQRVEECIVEIPDVVAAAVIGAPDLVRGEAIFAFVVRRTGAVLDPADIIKHCANRLAGYMVPKKVIFLDHLPMNAHGKIVKNELRSLTLPITHDTNG